MGTPGDLLVAPLKPYTDFWKVFGHSWFQYQTGPSGDQTGRIDALFRSSMDIEFHNWRNFAVSGAAAVKGTNTLLASGRATGGWPRCMQYSVPPPRTAGPYAPDGGGTLFCYGINDLGVYDGHVSANQTAYINAMRAMISRVRASRAFIATHASFAYGAGFTSATIGPDGSQDPAGVSKQATSTTSATITFTLPSDYKGEPVVFAFQQQPITYGTGAPVGTAQSVTNKAGTVTYSGTAGVTGTTYTGNGTPSGFLELGYMVRRITTLTASNAGQTIILTLSSIDASGTFQFDGAWLESLTPPPVIVCNIARSTTAGYNGSLYTNWRNDAQSFGGLGNALTDTQMDADVTTVNAALASMVAEFDGMVQIADVDTAINKDSTKTSDGVHPNENGAGPVMDAIVAARNRLTTPGSSVGQSLAFNGPSPRAGGQRRPRLVNQGYYCQDGILSFGTVTPVSGTMFAVPFVVTEAREFFSTIGIECTTAGTTASTVRLAVYDDPAWSGYPQTVMTGLDPTSTALSCTNSTGMKTASFSLGWPSDPGLYWFVLKWDTVGTSQVFRAVATGWSPFMPTARGSAGTGTTPPMGWTITGQGTGALTGTSLSTFPAGATLTQTPPVIQVFKTK